MSGSESNAGQTSSSAFWAEPPASIEARADEVHVWRIDLGSADQRQAAFWRTLSPEEQRRAERFSFSRDRERFVVARGMLRRVLAGYLGERPEDLRFLTGAHGKPRLDEAAGIPLRFNLSHANERALLAVALARDLGVDIEWIREELACEDIARQFFSASETAALQALPSEQRTQAFFHCWTRKEAYLKALGEGLTHPTQAFDVAFAPGEPAALLRSRRTPEDVARWSMRALDPGEGYAAAIVVEGRDWRLRCWQAA